MQLPVPPSSSKTGTGHRQTNINKKIMPDIVNKVLSYLFAKLKKITGHIF
jgi:hypothetical protein